MVLMIARIVLRELLFDLVSRRFDAHGLILDPAETLAAQIHHPAFVPVALVAIWRQHFAVKARMRGEIFRGRLSAGCERGQRSKRHELSKFPDHAAPLRFNVRRSGFADEDLPAAAFAVCDRLW